MNVAGALAPYVALFPTPVNKSDKCVALYCTDKFFVGKIPDNHDIIAFNIWSVVPIWLVLCLFLFNRARKFSTGNNHERKSSRFSVGVTFAFGIAALLIYCIEETRPVFYKWAHLTSAGVMIVMLIISMLPFARWMGPSPHRLFTWRLLRHLRARNVFSLLFWVECLLLVIWICIYLGFVIAQNPWNHAVFVIEVFALTPFAVYWIMQGLALSEFDRRHPEHD